MSMKVNREKLAIEILGFNPVGKEAGAWVGPNGETMYKLTPERAKFILEYFNTKNREISESQLKAIQESYALYGFVFDGDSLKFTKSGDIPDWQHRLKFIVKMGITVYTTISFGVPDDASTKTANAKARTPYDRIYISDKTASKDEVSTLKKMIDFRIYRSKPAGKALTWNTALDLWPEWKKHARRGEALTENFFEQTIKWNTYRRVFAAWSALLSFHGKEEIATTFLKMLEDVTKGREGTCVAREWKKLATHEEVTTMSNGRRPQYYYQLLCVAADQIEKDKSGDIQMGVSVSDVNHARLVQSGNYRLFLENPDGIQATLLVAV